MRRIAWLWLVGALVVALMGLSSSVGTLAGTALGQTAQQPPGSGGDEDDDAEDDDDEDDDDGDDDDADDDDDAGGAGDRAFCGSVMPVSTQAVRVNRERVAAVRVTGATSKASTVTVKLRRDGKLLASKSVKLNAGKSKLVKVKLSRKAFLKLRDKRQVKAIVTARDAAAQPGSGACSVPGFLDFDFDASSGTLGENPTGTFFWERLPSSYQGQVTCLQVTGNRASVGGIITASLDSSIVGRGLAFTVVDNTTGAPDLVSLPGRLSGLLPAPPTANTPACGDTLPPDQPVTGDIVVQDNMPRGGDDEDDDDDDDGDDSDEDDDGDDD